MKERGVWYGFVITVLELPKTIPSSTAGLGRLYTAGQVGLGIGCLLLLLPEGRVRSDICRS